MYPSIDLPFILVNASRKVDERLREKKREIEELEQNMLRLEEMYKGLVKEGKSNKNIEEKINKTKEKIRNRKELINIALKDHEA